LRLKKREFNRKDAKVSQRTQEYKLLAKPRVETLGYNAPPLQGDFCVDTIALSLGNWAIVSKRHHIDSASRIEYNAGTMSSSVRLTIGSLFVSVLLFAAVQGIAAGSDQHCLDRQIAERTKQYQESLRQRASEVSPSFQAKIEAQAERTVAGGLEKWNNGEIGICIALPHLAELQRVVLFVTRHLPGLPGDSLLWKASGCAAALTVTSIQLAAKSPAIYTATFAPFRSVVSPFRQSSEGISYFILIVCTIVQQR